MNTLTLTNDEYDELRDLVQYAFNTHYCYNDAEAFDTLTDNMDDMFYDFEFQQISEIVEKETEPVNYYQGA